MCETTSHSKNKQKTNDIQNDDSIVEIQNLDDSIFKTPTLCNNSFIRSASRKNLTKITNGTKGKATPVTNDKNCFTPRSSLKDKSLPLTPVTHMCSPSLSPKGRRHFSQHNRSIVKRFLSDSSLNASTPDCVDGATPQDNPQTSEEETSNFIVGVRVRPLNFRELSDPNVRNVVQMTDTEVELTCDTGTIHSFTYDHCFWSIDSNHRQYATQETVFNTMVLPLIDQVFLGYNACLLAYGQTGSGKSYSMMGLEAGIQTEPGPESGVIPRFCHELFRRISEINKEGGDCLVEISYFEIYNEKIHDLLGVHSNNSYRRTPLKVREHPTFGPYVVDLSAHCVRSYQDVQGWLTVGNSQRITAATGMNEKSSRSHSIFSIMLTQKEIGDENCLASCRSKVNLVDLAGSERVAQTCATGHKLKEGVSINKSLLSLGKVITFLSEKGRKKGVTMSYGPYRESVLTWLLRESLGGNSKTAMIATISPANIHLDETLATLRYACQARSIVNRVHKNEDANERIIRELRAEVEKITALRQELDRMKKLVEHSESQEKQDEIDRLKKQLITSEETLAKSQQSWTDRLKEAETLKSAELQYLKRCGVAIELHWDKSYPCLVNLAADPILTGTLMYLLPPGRVVVGKSVDSLNEKQPDIGLNGPLVHPNHCEIENRNEKLYLKPLEGCDTYVNGQVVKEETELQHGDRLVIGGIHYFRVSIPNKTESNSGEVIDFDFAHQEILRVQEERLRAELEASMQERFDYERQLHEMISVVELQTNALAEERKLKNDLEVERNVLQARMENQEHCKAVKKEEEECVRKISPYKSTFLKDLKSILNDKNFEIKISSDLGDVGLHEMRMMVREGTQRCKELGMPYEFLQQQIVGTDGLQPVIKVLDRENHMSTLWRPSKFMLLLNCLREDDQLDEIQQMLTDPSVTWEIDDAETNDHNISLNTSCLNLQLRQSLRQESVEEFNCSGTEVPEEVTNCLEEMKGKAQDLLYYCTNTDENALWCERIIKAMKYFDMFVSVAEGTDLDKLYPVKSSLKDGNADENCGKSVRFNKIS